MSETAEQSAPDLEPTPTPWEVERHTNGVIFITALHARGGDIADLYHVHTPKHGEPAIVQKDNAEANAALIVTAVNALEPMKEALQDIIAEFDMAKRENLKRIGFNVESLLVTKLRAALRLAGGEKE